MDIVYRVVLFLSVAMVFLADPRGMCGEILSPGEAHEETRAPDSETASKSNVGAWLVSIFRDHISAVDGSRCPSRPTCSSYSVAAFKKHGFLLGWVMTVDRLTHEIDEWSVSPVETINGQSQIIDPVENNDFWWFQGDEKNEE